MKTQIETRIKELTEKLDTLTNQKKQILELLPKIDADIYAITGALFELKNLLKAENKDNEQMGS